MSNVAEKLRNLQEMRNPTLRMQRILTEKSSSEAVNKLNLSKGEKGDPGFTPIKGKDYFTKEEIEQISSQILAKLMAEKKGDRGPSGRDGVGVKGEKGDPGRTPERGKDFWTHEDRVSMLKDLVNFIPDSPQVPTTEEIAAEVRKIPIKYKEIDGVPDLRDLPALIQFLKAGGFRGGGSSSSGSSSTVYTETPSGLINGVNTNYTVLHSITTVYSFAINGQFLHPTSDYTVSGSTITMVTALSAALSGLPFTIIYS